jgi:glycerol-3-phosphate dehydrogenase
MERDLPRLAAAPYDALVIGGGIYGACVAWDAALRGLSVALVDKGDFGHATSANTLRVIHGGLRYLQHGDIRRLRQSIRERHTLMRIAPHLVRPLPFLIPTYGHLLRGRAAFSAALLVNDLLSPRPGRGRDEPGTPWPRSRTVSRAECLRLCPDLERRGLTGGAIVYDGQTSSSERLLLAVARSASTAGAHLANHVEVTELLRARGRVVGARASDRLTGDELEIQARVVVNCAGPWLDRVRALTGDRAHPGQPLSKAFNLLVDRPLTAPYAVGIYGKDSAGDPDTPVTGGSRLYFITPWQGRALIGTAHLPYAADPDRLRVTEGETQAFLDDINRAYPAADLKPADVRRVYAGLLPMADRGGAGDVRLVRRYRIHDHEGEGAPGLISVMGVKLTEARLVAEMAVNLIGRKLGAALPASRTARTPVHGGNIERLDAFLSSEPRRWPSRAPGEIASLIERYGAAYPELRGYLEEPSPAAADPRERLARAEILHGIRAEMARTLADVVLRRTGLAAAGDPGDACLEGAAAIVAAELGWDARRTRRELDVVKTALAVGG